MSKKLRGLICICLSIIMVLSLGNTAFAKKVGDGDASDVETEIFSDDFNQMNVGIGKVKDFVGWASSSAIKSTAIIEVLEEDGNKYLKFYSNDTEVLHNPRLDLIVPAEGIKKITVSCRLKSVGMDSPVNLVYPSDAPENAGKVLATIAKVPQGDWTDVTIAIDLKKQTAQSYLNGKAADTASFDTSGLKSVLLRFVANCKNGTEMYLDDVKITTPDTDFGGFINLLNGEVNLSKIKSENPTGILDVARKTHPRIFFNDWNEIRSKIETDYNCKVWYDRILEYSEKMLNQPAVEYKRNDRDNINDVSTDVKETLVPMALAAGISKRSDIADRVYKELVSAGGWDDWGADAWLCTAHLLLGFACAYDWCYDLFTPEQRTNIRNIMKEKGFIEAVRSFEGYSNTSFTTQTSNWCQVCNGSIIAAALAVWDEEPALADYMLENALRCLPHGLIELKEDGSYSEPLSYWDYGIRHQVKAMSALDSSLEDGKTLPKIADFSDFPGMSKTGDFPIYYNGTTGAFNYGDGHASVIISPILFYLANKYGRPDWSGYVLDMESKTKPLSDINSAEALIWYDPENTAPPTMALDREYHNDVAEGANGLSFRDSFEDPNALVAMMIAGDLNAAHSDLNAGGFVLDRNGKRWVHMYGSHPGGIGTCYGWPNYQAHTQLGGHYQYYHARGEANNTLIANPTEYPDQNYLSLNKVIKSEFGANTAYGIIDMTGTNDAYADAKRGMMLTDGRSRLIIQDEVKLKSESEFYWFANTLAEITISKDGRSALWEYGGDRMLVRMTEAPEGAAFSIMDTVPLPTSPNPSAQIVINEHKLAIHLEHISDTLNLSVEFIPLNKGEGSPEASEFVPMANWSVDKGEKEPIKRRLPSAVALKINTPKAFAKGAYTYVDSANYDVMPIIRDDRTLVPVRFISENFGAAVSWDAATRKVGVSYKDKQISLTLDDVNMYVNGTARILDVPAQVVNDRTFIPLRALVEALGKEVLWDDRGLIVISDSTDNVTDDIKNELIDRLDITIKAGDDFVEGFDIDKSDYYIAKDVCDVSVFTNNNAKSASAVQGNPAVVTYGDKEYRLHFVQNEFSGMMGTNSEGVVYSVSLEADCGEERQGYQPFIYVNAVTASNFGSYPERGTVDGIISEDTSNRWSQMDENWLCYDFGEEKTIHSFALHGMLAATRAYKLSKIEASNDGQSWSTVLTDVKTNAINAPTVFELGDVRARYIKITGAGYEGTGDGKWNSWAEVRFYADEDMEAYDISHWSKTFNVPMYCGRVGDSVSLNLKGFDSKNNPADIDSDVYDILYESDNEATATVLPDGTVTIVGEGAANITVTVKNPIVKRSGSIAIITR